MSNFITKCLSGDALMSEVNDYIDMWHEGDFIETLSDFLGMTQKEYMLFVQDENYLGVIIAARKFNESIESVVGKEMAIAARTDNLAKVSRLQAWLESEGLWA